MPGMTRDNQVPFERKIRLITAAGIELPPAINDLKTRLAEVRRVLDANPVRDRLVAAIIAGDNSADTGMLVAAALAEAVESKPLRAELFDSIRHRINREIRNSYDAVAVENYRKLADRFNTAAEALTAAAAVVDVELPAEAIVDSTDKTRKAWRSAETSGTELTNLLPALAAAASLAGICGGDDPTDLLPLCVETAGQHRRHLWDAWLTEDLEALAARRQHSPFTVAEVEQTRTGRWGALLRMGATIRAAIEPVEPYRRPAPMVERTINEPGGPRRVVLDPEDPDFIEPQPATFTPHPARIKVIR